MPQQTSIYQLPYPEPTDIPDVPEDMRRLAEAVEIAIDSSIPVGVIMAWGGTAAPSGWHLCDGTPHGSPELKAIIGSDGTPDLRGRFILGAGGGYTRGQTGGAATVKLTAATSGIGAHTHVITGTLNVAAHQHHVAGHRAHDRRAERQPHPRRNHPRHGPCRRPRARHGRRWGPRTRRVPVGLHPHG